MASDGVTAARDRGQRRGEIARARMLDAGLVVFAGLSLDDLLSEVGPRRVIRELGDVSAGGFYHHFPDRESYLSALIDHALGPRADHVAPQTVAFLRELVEAPDPDVVAMIDQVCRSDFEREATAELPTLRFQLLAWIAHDEPAVRGALRRAYTRFTAQYVAAYEQVLARWGREFRPPFTSESAAVVLTALLEGLVLRTRVDPDAAHPELYGQAVVALLPAMTRPLGDSEPLDTVLDSIRSFPRPATVVPDDPALRQRVLDAALARADAGTFENASIEDIAQDAGVDAGAVHRYFTTKPGLAAATFARFVPMLERPLTRDLNDGESPVEVIQRFLEHLADIAARHRGLTNAFLEAVQSATINYGDHVGPHDPRAIVPLPQVLEPAVVAGQTQGVVRDDFDAVELAATVTNLLLLRVMTRPREPADQVAAIVSEVALYGIARKG